jgi:hypothetical protein
VLAGGEEGLQVWDAAEGKLRELPLPDGFRIAQFSKDGSRVLITTHDEIRRRHTARVWAIDSDEPPGPALVLEKEIDSIELSPDGRRGLAVSRERIGEGHDSELRFESCVWDVTTGRPLARVPTLWARSASFAADGTILILDSHGIWRWSPVPEGRRPEDVTDLAQLLAGRRADDGGQLIPLSPEEEQKLWQTVRQRDSDAFRRPDAEALEWHRDEASRAERRHDAFAAQHHLSQLLAASPRDGSLYARRAAAHFALGLWRPGAADSLQALLWAKQKTEQ